MTPLTKNALTVLRPSRCWCKKTTFHWCQPFRSVRGRRSAFSSIIAEGIKWPGGAVRLPERRQVQRRSRRRKCERTGTGLWFVMDDICGFSHICEIFVERRGFKSLCGADFDDIVEAVSVRLRQTVEPAVKC